MQNPPVLYDWRAFDQIWGAWELLNKTARIFKISLKTRSDPGIQAAHGLANQGRVQGCTTEGTGTMTSVQLEDSDLTCKVV